MQNKKTEISRQALLSILEDQELTLTELKKSQEHYKTLFNLSPTGIIILDSSAYIYDVNDEFVKMMGYKKNELIGKHISFISYSDDKKKIKTNLKKILSGEILEQEVTNLKKDGTKIIFELREKAMSLPNGEMGLLTICRDITKQKAAEEALKKSEERYKGFISQINEGVYRYEIIPPMPIKLSVEKQIDYLYDYAKLAECNKALLKMYGLKKENDFVGKSLVHFHGGRNNKTNREALRNFIKSGYLTEHAITEEKGLKGEIIYIDNNSTGVIVNNRLVRVWGTQTDITLQKKSELALKESEEKFRNLSENSNSSIFIITGNNFVYANKIALKTVGYSIEEVKKLKFWDVVHCDFRAQLKQNAAARQSGKKVPSRYEFKIVTKKGREIWVDFTASTILFDGKPSILCTAIDITDKKFAELALKESEEKFRTLTENANSGILILQGEKFVYINNAFTKISGYNFDDLSKSKSWNIVHPEFRNLVRRRALSRQTGKNIINNYEFKMISKSGKEIWIDFSATMINYKGKPAILGTGHDITEKKKIEISLRESEEKFRSLAESTNSGIFIVKGEYFDYFNPASEKLTGYTKEDARKLKFWEVVHPDHRKLIKKRGLARQKGQKVPQRYEFKIITKNGNTRWVDFFASKIIYQGVPSILGTIFDITDKKNTENKLHESLNRLEKSQQIASMGFLDWNLKTNEIFWSNELCRVFGNKKDTNKQTYESSFKIIHPSDRDFVKKNLALAVREKKEFDIDYRMITNDKRTVWVHAQAELIKDDKGKPLYLLGTVLDITKRKLAEDKLLEQFQKNEKILSTTMDGFIISDTKGKIVDVNDAYCKMMKYQKQELIGKNIEQLDIRFSMDQAGTRVKIFTQKGYDRFETIHRDKNGEMVDLDVSISLMTFEREKYVTAFVRDIRERKNYENEILEKQKQLRALSANLQSVREEERKLLARELHDELGQILTAAKIDLSLLEKSSPENKKEIKEIFNLINEGLITTKKIVSQLRPALLQELGLFEAVKELLNKFKQNTKLKTYLRTNVKDIKIDIEQSLPLYRIIQESLTNIAKHSKSDSARVNIYSKNKELIITIKDNGVGFDPEQTNFGGFGLLGMKERLIPLNGDIKIKSKIGIGTTVTVKVPFGIE